jgi:hypothetical protein
LVYFKKFSISSKFKGYFWKAVVYNVGTSGSRTNGISGNGNHIGGSAGSSYIQPLNMFQLNLLGAKFGKNLVMLKLI